MAKFPIFLWLLLSSLVCSAQEIEQSRLLASGYQPQSIEQASATLTAVNKVSTSTSVEYKAGQAVILQPGFVAQAGSVFLANVMPVGSSTSENNESVLSVRAYPNPFMDQTTIKYTLPMGGHVQYILLDAKGQPVQQSQARTEQPAGTYQTQIDGHDLPVGVYLYKLQVGLQTRTLRLIKK